MAGRIGGEVLDLRLSDALDGETVARLRQALLRYKGFSSTARRSWTTRNTRPSARRSASWMR
ncbi:hypothetical protein [Xylophilus sp.]|uniref:hypothetical protein n=1 Tax=Xylophilus sp. TaxID=2653893 RepID=UPI002D7F60CB|nr:hypothetical protein [Xylophilus sp.]